MNIQRQPHIHCWPILFLKWNVVCVHCAVHVYFEYVTSVCMSIIHDISVLLFFVVFLLFRRTGLGALEFNHSNEQREKKPWKMHRIRINSMEIDMNGLHSCQFSLSVCVCGMCVMMNYIFSEQKKILALTLRLKNNFTFHHTESNLRRESNSPHFNYTHQQHQLNEFFFRSFSVNSKYVVQAICDYEFGRIYLYISFAIYKYSNVILHHVIHGKCASAAPFVQSLNTMRATTWPRPRKKTRGLSAVFSVLAYGKRQRLLSNHCWTRIICELWLCVYILT